MSRGKLLNRHHKQRMKDKRKSDFTYHEGFPLNKHMITPKLCSCIMCGNARKYFGNGKESKTIQELKNEMVFQDALDATVRKIKMLESDELQRRLGIAESGEFAKTVNLIQEFIEHEGLKNDIHKD